MNPETTSPPASTPVEPEFATYRRELARLLAEGHAGKFALIHGQHIIGIWDSSSEAIEAGYARYALEVPFTVRKINPDDVERLGLLDAGMVRELRRAPRVKGRAV